MTLLAAPIDLVRSLGFTLVDGDRPGLSGQSRLVVALRDRPTLRHFDPEVIRSWVAVDGRGRSLEIDRRNRAGSRPFLWGHLHVMDRLGIENRFLSFGGRVEIEDPDPSERLVTFCSPGPIVRWGGHSQGSDDLAGEIGAFFGRLIIPVEDRPGAEARLAGEPPEHLYAAFLVDARCRRRSAAGARPRSDDGPGFDGLDRWMAGEWMRIRTLHPAWLVAGGALAADLGISVGWARP